MQEYYRMNGTGALRPQWTTYNPQRLEHPYGIGLFDDIHNVLPEVLYDSQMFAGQPFVGLLQRRVETLFEGEYARARATYRLFQMEARRRESGILLPASVMRSPAEPVRTPRPMPTTPASPPIYANISSIFGGVGGVGSGVGSRSSGETIVENILASIFSGIGSAVGMVSTATTATTATMPATTARVAEDDPETPTVAQIGRSTILTSVEPTEDVVCSICTDHRPPRAPWSSWRIIQHCGHRFHASCIDQWFQHSSRCPMCRYDIREYNVNQF